ncbi:transglycosylase family protein [Streptomyces sp. NPDC006997]|uniref:transglycosylase family protein n=1 Tax=Streptomyces sp. NPDC006997 TaxID=3155356 RepID=UPI0033FE5724
MLSGNGRHRRPRQAPALLVAAGVTGSAIAIPLLGASGASAADGTVWDQVAECESGGSWSADNGSGYYGGLQISQDDWESYGGLDYAGSADLASRSQQIAVAERILADQGPGAWPACGLLSGLTKDSGSADVDTGLAEDSPASSASSDAPDDSADSTSEDADGTDQRKDKSTKSDKSTDSAAPEATSDSKSSSDSGSASDSGRDAEATSGSGAESDSVAPRNSPTASTKSDPSDASLRDGDASDATSGSGRHRGDSADEDSADGARAESSGRHASRDAARDAAVTADGAYTVQPGDNLTYIADSLDLDGGWCALYEANEDAVGADPDLILPGQTLEVGVETGAK